MVVYSISDLEKLSGVKAHTIRIWEKRYDIITPRRTSTNVRYYLDEDLRRVINIAFLNKHGVKISKIASMSDQMIAQKVGEIADIDESFQGTLDTLTLSLIELDESKFRKLLDKNIADKGFERTMLDMIYPLLDKLSIMWITGSIKTVHERFVTHMIKRKCVGEIEKFFPTRREIFLIFLPEGEVNDLSLLFLHFLLAKRGFRVIHAGSDMDLTAVAEVLDIVQPHFVYTIINNVMLEQNYFIDFAKQLGEIFNEAKVLISGVPNENVDLELLPKNVSLLRSSEDTIEFLDRLVAN